MARKSQGAGAAPHPRKIPRFDGPLTPETLGEVFRDCVDFTRRPVALEGLGALTLCYLGGMVRMERVSDYVLRPLAEDAQLRACGSMARAMARMEEGALYNLGWPGGTPWTRPPPTWWRAGACCFFPGKGRPVLLHRHGGEALGLRPGGGDCAQGGEGRLCGERAHQHFHRPPAPKGPELRIKEQTVGRQSLTLVDVLYLEGVTDPGLVEQLWDKLADMDVDGVFLHRGIEEYIVPAHRTPFPLVQYTERSDRFCAGLCEGRVGLLIDGIPLGYLTRRCWATSSRPPRTSPTAGCWPPPSPCCGTAACSSPSSFPPSTWPWSPSTRR